MGSSSSSSAAVDMLFDDDASSNDDEVERKDGIFDDDRSTTKGAGTARSVVDSYSNQRYGAVSCQIHARGVHTSLLMDVAVSEDGLYAFGGVQRGSVELAAVYLGDVEAYLDERLSSSRLSSSSRDGVDNAGASVGLLDLIQVDRHADAKLKGFGACTRLWNGWERARNGIERPEYLLCTGKGIKVSEEGEGNMLPEREGMSTEEKTIFSMCCRILRSSANPSLTLSAPVATLFLPMLRCVLFRRTFTFGQWMICVVSCSAVTLLLD